MDTPKTLFQRLSEHSAGDSVPFHTPGHKRNTTEIDFLENLGASLDISEITGFDDLHNAHGLLREAMERAAGLWHSERSFFLVNGSTGGILAAVRAAARVTGSRKLIMARNCHKAVYNAAQLCHLEPVYIAAPTVEGFGFCGSIPPKSVEQALSENPGAPVILTSPTYEGIISNIADIAVICHLHGSPLIVDEAHGSHLDLSAHFTGGAVRAGADIVVQSIHKTLTGLTQSAILHLNSEQISPETVQTELSIFQSSSPSYLLMASIDGTVDLIASRGGELFGAWKKRLDRFDKRVADLKTLKLPGHSELFACQARLFPAGYKRCGFGGKDVFGFDRSKIIISCEGTEISGVELMRQLSERYNIECEMALGGYCLALTSIIEKKGALDRLADAIIELDAQIRKTIPRVPLGTPKLPPTRMSVWDALEAPSRSLSLRDARGRVAAEYVYAYPPGIPIVTPGEELTEEIVGALIVQREAGVSLKSSTGGMPRQIRVIA